MAAQTPTALLTTIKPYENNEYYFDNIEGEKWTEFLKSVREEGVLEPILINQDRIIVSGHQRYRASLELELGRIPYREVYTENEDDFLKKFIETNLKQRGDGNPNDITMGRCLRELARIYGIKRGGDRKSDDFEKSKAQIEPLIGDSPSTMQELANKYDNSLASAKRKIGLADAIPELEKAYKEETISANTALAIIRQLSEEEQVSLLSQLDITKKYTAKQVQSYIDQIEYLKSHPNLPDDYEDMKAELKSKEAELEEALAMAADYNDRASESEVNAKTIEQLKAELAARDEELQNKDEEIRKLQSDTETFNSAAFLERSKKDAYRALDGTHELYELGRDIREMIETKLAPIKYKRCFERVGVSEVAKENVLELVDIVESWCREIRSTVSNKTENSETIIDM